MITYSRVNESVFKVLLEKDEKKAMWAYELFRGEDRIIRQHLKRLNLTRQDKKNIWRTIRHLQFLQEQDNANGNND